jgi:hypothetical protein
VRKSKREGNPHNHFRLRRENRKTGAIASLECLSASESNFLGNRNGSFMAAFLRLEKAFEIDFRGLHGISR